MKWFKHDSYASNDPKLEKLRMKYGVEGYGLYFYCLEMIAREVTSKKYTFELEHDSELIAFNLKMDSKKVEEILMYCVNQGLFQINENNIITCFNMLKRLDDSTTKNPQIRELIDNADKLQITQKNSEKLRKTPSRIEKNRKEKKRKEDKEEIIIPEGINETSFNEFVEHRKSIKKPMSNMAKTKIINILKYYTEEDQQKLIDYSIASNYQSIYQNEKLEEIKDYDICRLYPYNKRFLLDKYEQNVILSAINCLQIEDGEYLEGNKAVDKIEKLINKDK